MYHFVDDTLYRRRPNGVKLKCVSREEVKELLAEIHKGMCGSHIGSRELVGKHSGKDTIGRQPSKMRLS